MKHEIIDNIQEIKNNRKRIYYVIKTKYGLLKILKDNYIKGIYPTIKNAINPNKYFINLAKDLHNNTYDYSLVKYVDQKTSIKIICKYHGIFEQKPQYHIGNSLSGCPKCSGKNKTTEDILKQARSIHTTRYDYGEFKYKYNTDKIPIYCKIHGLFKQQVSVHLAGSGCPVCGKDSLNGRVWSYSKWEEQANNSKNFDSFKVYILECTFEDEIFYKIGKTFTTVTKRYYGNKNPYNYRITNEFVFKRAIDCCKFEKQLHSFFKDKKYKPNIKFNGSNECFKI